MISKIIKLFTKPQQYYCYVFLFDHKTPKVWHDDQWEWFSKTFDKVIDKQKEKPHLKVKQFLDNEGREEVKHKALKWDDQSFNTWLIKSNQSNISHYTTQLSLPSLQSCNKNKKVPLLFFHTLDMNAIMEESWELGYRMLLAVREDIYIKYDFANEIKLIKETLLPKQLFFKKRPWDYVFGDSDKDTLPISNYSVIMPMYNERKGQGIGEPKFGWVNLI